MTDDRPLRVRVAEKLGCKIVVHACELRGKPYMRYCCGCEDFMDGGGHGSDAGDPDIPYYDTDWNATGPLIERLKISIRPVLERDASGDTVIGPHWVAEISLELVGFGCTPLIAVCNLILVLPEEMLNES